MSSVIVLTYGGQLSPEDPVLDCIGLIPLELQMHDKKEPQAFLQDEGVRLPLTRQIEDSIVAYLGVTD